MRLKKGCGKMSERVLIGVPINLGTMFGVPSLIRALKGQDWKDRDIIFIDRAREERFIDACKNVKDIEWIKSEFLGNEREAITRDRNELRKIALEKKFDYLMLIEQEILPPENFLSRAVGERKDVFGGIFFPSIIQKPNDPEKPIIKNRVTNLSRFEKTKGGDVNVGGLTLKDVLPSKAFEIDMMTLNIALISRKVLEKVEFKTQGNPLSEDLIFATDCKKEGFCLFSDSSIVCGFRQGLVVTILD